MNDQTLYIRADASSTMGTGHVMRCIALAQAWQHWGGAVCFITHVSSPVLRSIILAQGYEHKNIQTPCPDHADIHQTLQFIASHSLNQKQISSPAWVVLDGYHFNPEYQKAIQGAGYRVLVLDDHNHLHKYYADLLLNQNPAALSYGYKCSNNTQKLLGTRYTLIRNEFLSKTDKKKSTPKKATRILITLGGADTGNITPCIIQAIQNLNDADLEIRAVVGPSNPRLDTLKSIITRKKIDVRLVQNPDMPEIMEWADIAITTGGSTCWELCFMGLPFVVIPIAQNQMDIAKCLERDMIAVNLGPIDNSTPKKTTAILKDLIHSPLKREVMSALGKDIIDGGGAKRVIRQMLTGIIHTKKNNHLKNNTKKISQFFYTGYKSKLPIGHVKSTKQSQIISIGYTIEKPFQGLSLCPALLEKALKQLKHKSKADNLNNCTFELEPLPHSCKNRLTITLISDKNSWINPYLFQLFVQILLQGHRVRWIHHVCFITASDIVFYLSCGQLAPAKILDLNKHNIVVHGSPLPKGKGWSPISWQILEGQNIITLTLFEAMSTVDSGAIYLQKKMAFNGNELIDEIREKTARYTIDLCLDFLNNHKSLSLSAKKQKGDESFYPKRTPEDSRIDPDRTIREQFNLLRIADNQNYPVFFTHNGVNFKLAISKMEKTPNAD